MSRVLIVDDNVIDRELLADAIESHSKQLYASEWDLKITKVGSAVEALNLMKSYTFELIVTDILMAKMDGWELIKEIRKTKSNSVLPIVVVSAVDGIELEYNSKRHGASLWFTKPIDPEDFAEKIFKLIRER